MSTSRVAIIGLGMITPLGTSADQSAASIRAGLTAAEETSLMDRAFDPFVLATVPDDCLAELAEDAAKDPCPTYREARMLCLATVAIRETVAGLPKGTPPPSLFLGLPEIETRRKLDPDQFLKKLSIQCPDEISPGKGQGRTGGRAAGLGAISNAVKAIQNGSVKLALAGGVDTYKDLYVLGTLDMQDRISTPRTMDGFVPGEAAAFVLLAEPGYAGSLGITPLAYITGTATGSEPGHLYSKEPYKGEGLAGTVQELLKVVGNGKGPVATIFSSMNGENHFGKEWGVTYSRCSGSISEQFRIEHPADCIGDTGAASGPIMVGLATVGYQKGYLSGPALVYASSDTALRAACLIAQA